MPWLSPFLASGLFIWTAVTLVWILSLIIHDSSGEDFRYARWRAEAGASWWWRSYFFAFASGAWWTFISALLMTFLLLRVSVVAMLERTVKESKPGYETYGSQTNAFFPGLPRGLRRYL